jgi:hypothetical protein
MLAMDKYNAVRNYLQTRMPGHEISDREATPVRPFGFILRKDDMSYALEFESEFVADNDVPAILHALDEWHVLEEICRGEGLQYVLTKRGLRLDSSN